MPQKNPRESFAEDLETLIDQHAERKQLDYGDMIGVLQVASARLAQEAASEDETPDLQDAKRN